MAIRFVIRGDIIQLDQLLKATGLCPSGGAAKSEIAASLVKVDGQLETRKRAQLRPGQVVEYAGQTVEIAALAPGEQPPARASKKKAPPKARATLPGARPLARKVAAPGSRPVRPAVRGTALKAAPSGRPVVRAAAAKAAPSGRPVVRAAAPKAASSGRPAPSRPAVRAPAPKAAPAVKAPPRPGFRGYLQPKVPSGEGPSAPGGRGPGGRPGRFSSKA